MFFLFMCFDAPVIRSLTRKFRLILLALLRSERFSFNDCLGGTAWVTFQTNSWKINPQNSEVHLRRPFIAASVLTYPVNPAYEICSPERKFFNTLWLRNRADAKSKYSVIRWRNKIEPSSLPQILYSRKQPHSQVFSRQSKMQISRALRRILCCQVLGTRVNPDTCRIVGYMWTGKSDYGYVWTWKFMNPGKKVANSKISGYVCARGLSVLKMAATVYERDTWFGDES